MIKSITKNALAVSVVLAFVSWTTPVLSQSSNAAQVSTVAFPHTIQSPCNGHIIDLDGTVHVTLHTASVGNGRTMLIQNVNFSGIKGTSRNNGDSYNCVSAQNQKVLINNSTGTAAVTVNVTQNLIGLGSAPDMLFHIKQNLSVDMTTTPHTVTVVSETVSFTCK